MFGYFNPTPINQVINDYLTCKCHTYLYRNLRKIFFIREAPVSLCVVCALSHGEDGVFMDVKGDEIIIEREIVKPFYNDNCPVLIGIPKLFIFSCCRGDDLAEKIQVWGSI